MEVTTRGDLAVAYGLKERGRHLGRSSEAAYMLELHALSEMKSHICDKISTLGYSSM